MLLIFSVLFMTTALVSFSCRRLTPAITDDLRTLTTESTTTTAPSTEPSTTTEETTAEETTTEEMTTEPTTEPEPVHHYSHIIVFLDVQRAVFYHTPEGGKPIAEVALRVSTGAGELRTPTTPPDKPFILSGYWARVLLFTKSRPIVWVRYATHVSGDIFFHSQPYDHFVDEDGKDVPLDKSLFNLAGYNVLGQRTISHGCIRLAMRDAIFLANNIHKGMPVYIFDSSKDYIIPQAESLPPAESYTMGRWDPTDMDPANPYRQREANNMAWRYRPTVTQPVTPIGTVPPAADTIANRDKLPAGTTFRYLHTPDVSVPVLRTVLVVVTYPDGSYEEVRTKIRVVDPAQTTPTTTEPVTTEPTTTEPVTTTAPPTTTAPVTTPSTPSPSEETTTEATEPDEP